VATFYKETSVTSTGTLLLLHIPKTSNYFPTFFSEMSIPGKLWVWTKISEWLMQ